MKENENLYKIALGENIRKIRKKAKLTQDIFSEIIGIEPSSLSNIENGKSFPSALTINLIQEKLNIRSEEIFDLESLKSVASIDEDIQERLKSMDENKKKVLWKIIKTLEF